MSHADILDIDRGHIFRKHRHKNNKKVAVIYEENGKKPAVARVFARQLPWGEYIKSAIPACVVRTRTYLTRKAITHAHVFDAEGFAAQRRGGIAARSLTLHDRPTC